MVRFLLSLTFLLLTLLRSNYVQAACYASTWSNGVPVYSSLFVDGGTTLAQCQAIACQAYPGISQNCPSTCQQVSETQTQSCPVNYTGQITQTRVKTCPDNQWQAWTTTQNSCVANPPTCQISSQQQTLSCQTGYTGSITQTRSSTCPDPYGSPTWLPWVTTSDTCKKSINNPTNPASPVSPLSPASQPTTISAPTTQSSPVTASTPNTVPNSETTPTASTETSQTQTKTDSPTTSSTQASPSPPPKGKTRSVVGLALSLELFVKPGLQQPNMFFEPQLVSGIPNAILTQDLIMMDLLQQSGFNQPAYNQDLGFEQ
jgi:hypothetical protein